MYRYYDGAGISYGPVSASVCLSVCGGVTVANRHFVKKTKLRISKFSGIKSWQNSKWGHPQRSVVRLKLPLLTRAILESEYLATARPLSPSVIHNHRQSVVDNTQRR